MNELKPILRLLMVTQTFLLFAIVFLPTLTHYLRDSWGRFVYGVLAAACIYLTLLLRRALSQLD